jgi:putative heme iron utilization protein
MDPETASSLRRLLATQPVGALATLHRGEPAVSMVPFVVPAGATHLVIHVSALATHTADMLAHPRVALLVTAPLWRDTSPQALPRVSLQADAQRLERDGAAYGDARAAYLARFADAAQTFDLADFSLFVLRPLAARLVGGFARATSLTGDRLNEWLLGGNAGHTG